MNHELPNGWIVSTIKNVSGICEQKVPDDDEQFLYVDIGSIDRDLKRIASPQSIQGRDAPSRARKCISTGDVLVSLTRPNLNAVALVTPDFDGQVASTGFEVLRPVLVDSRYLFYLVRTRDFIEKISGLTQGALYPAAKSADVREYQFPLAPLSEQIRIADKLDRVLARVNAAQARLDKIPTLIKRFRQSVLAAATSGELTREWRGNDGNSEQFLTWAFPVLPDTWSVKLLPEIASSRLGKMLDKSKNQGVSVRYLGNINVRWGHFELSDLKEILISQKEKDELTIQDGDLLVCEGGEPGRSAVWRGGENNLTFQKALHRIRFDELVLPEFALYCFQNDYFGNRLMTLFTGTTIKHLTGKALKRYPIPIPPIDEQKEIVRRVESLFALADSVEKQYQEAKSRTDRLSQAILAKAFRGELVSQNPDDEPAEALLQRIQQQRAEQAVSNRKSSGKGRGNTAKTTEASQTTKVAAMTLSEAPKGYLLKLLQDMHGTAEASVLWKKSGLSIDDFYALLKQETAIQDDNASADPSQRKLKIRQ